MDTWFTADLHLGHRNIIDYCDRPFADVDEMNHALITNWNDTVAADDTVWLAGDFALGRIADTLPLAGRLNGRKILVTGNHDRCWHGNDDKADGWTERYLDAGFAEIVQGEAMVEIGDGVTAIICHFPYRGDSHDHDRFTEHRPVDRGGWLIHGHVHDKWTRSERMINVGVDVAGFRPVNARQLIATITASTVPSAGRQGIPGSARVRR